METNRVRFGGQEKNGRFCFELTGGALALDFVNTLDEREGEPKELLIDYGRLLDWCEQAEALPPPVCKSLRNMAEQDPRRARNVLRSAKRLRELLFRCFESVANDRQIGNDDLTSLNRWAAKISQSRCLRYVDGELHWVHYSESPDLSAVLGPVVESAIEILGKEQTRKIIKMCEGDGCAWAFLDQSRHRNRRWCDMSVCGNRAKARRHRQRTRKAPARSAK